MLSLNTSLAFAPVKDKNSSKRIIFAIILLIILITKSPKTNNPYVTNFTKTTNLTTGNVSRIHYLNHLSIYLTSMIDFIKFI